MSATQQEQTLSCKFITRYTLGLFLLSNWVYNNLICGEDGISDFSTVPSDIFTDKLFFMSAYKQLEEMLLADINDSGILAEMMESKSFLLNRKILKELSVLNEEKMMEMVEGGHNVYSLLLGKKMAENIIFDDEVVPTSYSVIDGSDLSVSDQTIPMHLIFSMDSDTLEKMERLLNLSDNTIVTDIVDELSKDEKFTTFSSAFNLLKKLDATY